MASAGQESMAPPRLSRYRSTRKAEAQQAAADILPTTEPTKPVSRVEAVHAVQSQQHETQGSTVQRSMSRYHKSQKPIAAVAAAATSISPPQLPPDLPRTHAANGARRPSKDQQGVKMVVRENTTRDSKKEGGSGGGNGASNLRRERSAPTQMLAHSSDQLSHARNLPQQANGIVAQQTADIATPLQASRSRYRRPAPTKQESLPNLRATAGLADPQNTHTLKMKQEHRDAIRKIHKQATFPVSSEQPPLPRLLTKASLDQIPDANKDDGENYFNQLKALKRNSTLGSQSKPDLIRAPRAHASKAQNEVKKMMDAETERQRRVQEKIKMEREKAKADEEARVTAKRQEKERKVIEKQQREERQREEKAGSEAAARERKELEKAERKKKPLLADQLMPRRHQRKESQEERMQRHRDRSLSALEGSEASSKVAREAAMQQPAPLVPKEPLAFLKRRRADDTPSSKDKHRDQKPAEEVNIRPGGGGIVPGVDAPISAVNAGDRRVMVECNQSSITLPVTPTTTPVDLIRSAATCMNETIDVKASVLLESFGKVGVQRPLRRYEHMRDMMNSWDDDNQNSVIIVPSATGGADPDLDCTSVAAEHPEEVSFQLQYSQRPGKWEKRWVTLRSDGQIVSAKNEGHKDITNVCHMSDFDIYTPSQQQLTKKIKPPKKLCFAIKSQQKSAMFLSAENFVHFFCTGDKQTAADWYKAVQGWRSWYLVNVMGKGTKPKPKRNGAPVLPEITGTQEQRPGSRDSHYQLGSFKPLLDFDMFGVTNDAQGTEGDQLGDLGLISHARNNPSRSGGPPSSYPSNLLGDWNSTHTRDPSKPLTRGSAEDDTFAPTGLLGHGYSTRQKGLKDRDPMFGAEGPFTGGLLEAQLRPSMDQGRPNLGDLNRSASAARRGKPLVGLSSGHQDASPPSRKGRAFVPEQIGAGGLVQAATGPDAAPLGRNRSTRRPGDDRDSNAQHGPFVADGLLSNTPAGQGGGTTGRGVMDGSRVRVSQGMGPMLDLNVRSNFADGSLLRKVEAEEAPRAPVIERRKGQEIVVGTGEGL